MEYKGHRWMRWKVSSAWMPVNMWTAELLTDSEYNALAEKQQRHYRELTESDIAQLKKLDI